MKPLPPPNPLRESKLVFENPDKLPPPRKKTVSGNHECTRTPENFPDAEVTTSQGGEGCAPAYLPNSDPAAASVVKPVIFVSFMLVPATISLSTPHNWKGNLKLWGVEENRPKSVEISCWSCRKPSEGKSLASLTDFSGMMLGSRTFCNFF